MNKIYKCKCSNVLNNNICKNKTKNPFYIKNKPICKFHCSYYYEKYVLIIQKHYKSYKQRKLINNIYKKLPCDIQNKILYYVNEDYYYKQYLKTISNIVEKKIINLINFIQDKLDIIIDESRQQSGDFSNPLKMFEIYNYFNNHNNITNIYKIFGLYKKYYHILEHEEAFVNILSNFQLDFYSYIRILESSNYFEFYYLLNSLYYKINNYINPNIFLDYSEA
jgi:hypothetical protein